MTRLSRILRYVLVPFRAGHKWINDRCTTYAAALAYYSAFSLAPILIIAVSVAGLIFGEQAASGRIVGELESLIGAEGAALIQRMISASANSGEGWVATLIGTGAMLLGATGLFMQMGHAFEAVFGRAAHQRSAWVNVLMGRLRGLTVIIGVGFLLMVSLVASAAILAIGEYATRGMEALLWLASLLQMAITIALQTSMIAMIYKVLVPIRLSRRALLTGALFTAVLFEVGKWGVGVYMGRSGIGSTFGAAGSLAVILVWVYYVSLIMLYGAEITFQLHRLDKVGDRVIRRRKPGRDDARRQTRRTSDEAQAALLKPQPEVEPSSAERPPQT
jgi:membrane protein